MLRVEPSPVLLPPTIFAEASAELEEAHHREEFIANAMLKISPWRRKLFHILDCRWTSLITHLLIAADFVVATADLSEYFWQNSMLAISDAVILAMLALMTLMKFFAMGRLFFRDLWGVAFSVAIMLSVVDALVILSCRSCRFLDFSRVLLVIRPMRALIETPGTRILVRALRTSVRRILSVMAIFVTFVVLMAVGSLEFFRGDMRQRCYPLADALSFNGGGKPLRDSSISCCGLSALPDDANVTDVAVAEMLRTNPSTIVATSSLPQQSIVNICPYGFVCISSEAPLYDMMNFRTFPSAAFIVFSFVASTEDWSRVVNYLKDANGWTGPTMFFLIIFFVGAIFLSNLMLATIIEGYQHSAALEETKQSIKRSCLDQNGEILLSREAIIIKPSILQEYCRRIVSQTWYTRAVVMPFIVNFVSVAVWYRGIPSVAIFSLFVVQCVSTFFLMVDFLLRFASVPPRDWLRDPLNIIDFIIMVGSVIALFFWEYRISSIFASLRLLRLVLLIPILRQLAVVFYSAAKSTLGLLAMLFLMIYLFAVVGMQFFAGTQCNIKDVFFRVNTTYCNDVPRENFDSIGYAMLTSFELIVGEGWDIVMHRIAWRTSLWASLYFVLWRFLGGIIAVNLFIAIFMLAGDTHTQRQAALSTFDIDVEMETVNNNPLENSLLESSPQLKLQRIVSASVQASVGIVSTRYARVILYSICIIGTIASALLHQYMFPPDHYSAKPVFIFDVVSVLASAVDMAADVHQALRSGFSPRILIVGIVFLCNIIVFAVPRRIARMIRISRLSLVWLLVASYPQGRVIVRALISMLSRAVKSVFIFIFVTALYAVVGTHLFAGKLNACSRDSWGDVTYWSPFITTAADCESHGYRWDTVYPNYDNPWGSFLALFQLATGSQWPPIIYAQDMARNDAEAPLANSNPLAMLYGLSYVVLVVFYLLGYVTSDIVDGFFLSRASLLQQAEIVHSGATLSKVMTQEQIDGFDFMRRSILFVRPRLANSYVKGSWRDRLRRVVRSKISERVLFLLTVIQVSVNVLRYTIPEITGAVIVTSFVFNMIFIAAWLAKAIVYEKMFVRSIRNGAEGLINVTCFVGDIMTIITPSVISRSLSLFYVLRLYRIFFISREIVFLLFLFKESAASVAILLILFSTTVVAFAFLGMELFALVPWGEDRDSIFYQANFGDFGSTISIMIRLTTTDSWGTVMYACAGPCQQQVGACLSPIIAHFYFITVIVILKYASVPIFAGILMEGFKASERQRRFAVQLSDVNHFCSTWKFCNRGNHVLLELPKILRFLRIIGKPWISNCSSSHQALLTLAELDIPLWGLSTTQEELFFGILRRRFVVELPEMAWTELRALLRLRFPQYHGPMSTSSQENISAMVIQSWWRGKMARSQRETLHDVR